MSDGPPSQSSIHALNTATPNKGDLPQKTSTYKRPFIHEGNYLVLLLMSTIKTTNQFTYGLPNWKAFFRWLTRPPKSLLVIHNHAHIKFNFIIISFSSKILDQLNDLSFSQVLVLNMYINVFQPWLKDLICSGWVSTLQFANFGFAQFVEFLCCHLHFISGWICSRIDSFHWFILLRISSGGRSKSPQGSEAKCTWHGWLCDPHVASLASSFSNCDLPMTGMPLEIPEACTNAAPCLAFTIPGKILNASLWSSSICMKKEQAFLASSSVALGLAPR